MRRQRGIVVLAVLLFVAMMLPLVLFLINSLALHGMFTTHTQRREIFEELQEAAAQQAIRAFGPRYYVSTCDPNGRAADLLVAFSAGRVFDHLAAPWVRWPFVEPIRHYAGSSSALARNGMRSVNSFILIPQFGLRDTEPEFCIPERPTVSGTEFGPAEAFRLLVATAPLGRSRYLYPREVHSTAPPPPYFRLPDGEDVSATTPSQAFTAAELVSWLEDVNLYPLHYLVQGTWAPPEDPFNPFRAIFDLGAVGGGTPEQLREVIPSTPAEGFQFPTGNVGYLDPTERDFLPIYPPPDAASGRVPVLTFDPAEGSPPAYYEVFLSDEGARLPVYDFFHNPDDAFFYHPVDRDSGGTTSDLGILGDTDHFPQTGLQAAAYNQQLLALDWLARGLGTGAAGVSVALLTHQLYNDLGDQMDRNRERDDLDGDGQVDELRRRFPGSLKELMDVHQVLQPGTATAPAAITPEVFREMLPSVSTAEQPAAVSWVTDPLFWDTEPPPEKLDLWRPWEGFPEPNYTLSRTCGGNELESEPNDVTPDPVVLECAHQGWFAEGSDTDVWRFDGASVPTPITVFLLIDIPRVDGATDFQVQIDLIQENGTPTGSEAVIFSRELTVSIGDFDAEELARYAARDLPRYHIFYLRIPYLDAFYYEGGATPISYRVELRYSGVTNSGDQDEEENQVRYRLYFVQRVPAEDLPCVSDYPVPQDCLFGPLGGPDPRFVVDYGEYLDLTCVLEGTSPVAFTNPEWWNYHGSAPAVLGCDLPIPLWERTLFGFLVTDWEKPYTSVYQKFRNQLWAVLSRVRLQSPDPTYDALYVDRLLSHWLLWQYYYRYTTDGCTRIGPLRKSSHARYHGVGDLLIGIPPAGPWYDPGNVWGVNPCGGGRDIRPLRMPMLHIPVALDSDWLEEDWDAPASVVEFQICTDPGFPAMTDRALCELWDDGVGVAVRPAFRVPDQLPPSFDWDPVLRYWNDESVQFQSLAIGVEASNPYTTYFDSDEQVQASARSSFMYAITPVNDICDPSGTLSDPGADILRTLPGMPEHGTYWEADGLRWSVGYWNRPAGTRVPGMRELCALPPNEWPDQILWRERPLRYRQRINVNTAPFMVLKALAAKITDDEETAEEFAINILDYREWYYRLLDGTPFNSTQHGSVTSWYGGGVFAMTRGANSLLLTKWLADFLLGGGFNCGYDGGGFVPCGVAPPPAVDEEIWTRYAIPDELNPPFRTAAQLLDVAYRTDPSQDPRSINDFCRLLSLRPTGCPAFSWTVIPEVARRFARIDQDLTVKSLTYRAEFRLVVPPAEQWRLVVYGLVGGPQEVQWTQLDAVNLAVRYYGE